MKTVIDLLQLNIQVLQVGVFIWGVFEIKAVRREFSDHMQIFHQRRKEDEPNGKGI